MQSLGFSLLLFLAFFISFVLETEAQQESKTDARLQKALVELTKDFKGVAGIYVYNLKTNRVAALNADTVFPTASLIKVPILAAVFNKIAEEKYTYLEPLLYRKDRSYGGSGLMQFFKDSTQIIAQYLFNLKTSVDEKGGLTCRYKRIGFAC